MIAAVMRELGSRGGTVRREAVPGHDDTGPKNGARTEGRAGPLGKASEGQAEEGVVLQLSLGHDRVGVGPGL